MARRADESVTRAEYTERVSYVEKRYCTDSTATGAGGRVKFILDHVLYEVATVDLLSDYIVYL